MSYYKKRDNIIAETIEGESIILSLNKGVYYACRNASSVLWVALEQGASIPYLKSIFVDGDKHEADIEHFIQQLMDEELICEEQIIESSPESDAQIHFQDLSIEIYTDMKELLELDPVHEIYHHKTK